MRGSYSIKYVLPALVPELRYDGLAISDGGIAMDAYAQLQYCSDPELIGKTIEDLSKYCELDTLAMVKVLEVLQKQACL